MERTRDMREGVAFHCECCDSQPQHVQRWRRHQVESIVHHYRVGPSPDRIWILSSLTTLIVRPSVVAESKEDAAVSRQGTKIGWSAMCGSECYHRPIGFERYAMCYPLESKGG